jgi:hypothetical protein
MTNLELFIYRHYDLSPTQRAYISRIVSRVLELREPLIGTDYNVHDLIKQALTEIT